MGRGGGGETREFVFTQIKRLYWGTWWWSNLMNRSSCINCSCEGNLTGEKVACPHFMMPGDLVKRVVEA